MVYENCREKWPNIMKLKKRTPGKLILFSIHAVKSPTTNSKISCFFWQKNLTNIYTGAKISRTGDEAKQFEAKWALTKEGQKKYGGWKDGAYRAYDTYYTMIETLHQYDEANGFAFQKYCQDIMREVHCIPEDQLESCKNGRKRVPVPKAPPVIDVTKRRVKRKVQE